MAALAVTAAEAYEAAEFFSGRVGGRGFPPNLSPKPYTLNPKP